MNEFFETPETGEAEFYLGTVSSWSNANGVKVVFDGQTSPTTKGYKMMQVSRPLQVGERVIIMKKSGTYIVLGAISLPNSRKKIDDLSNSASTADIISKVNTILAWMRTQGILYT